MATFTRYDLKKIFDEYGVPESVWYPIMMVESGGNAAAMGDYVNGAPQSYGLFQLNRSGGLGYGYSIEELLDPLTNAKIAAQSMGRTMKKALELGLSGYDLTQYVAYNSGWPTKQGLKALDTDPVVQAYEPKLQKAYAAYEREEQLLAEFRANTEMAVSHRMFGGGSALSGAGEILPLTRLNDIFNPPKNAGITEKVYSIAVIILFMAAGVGLVFIGVSKI